MRLHAHEVKPGPHWVRAQPDAEWFYLDIQNPDALRYGLDEAEYEPIPRPDDPVAGLPAGLPSQLYQRNRRAETALATAKDDIDKLVVLMSAGRIYMSVENDKVCVRMWSSGEKTKRQATDETKALLPGWGVRCPPEDEYDFISLEHRIDGEMIAVTIYGMSKEVSSIGQDEASHAKDHATKD